MCWKVNNLEVARWHYIADEQPVTHIGPFAKEFYEAFGTGDDYSISTIDPSGVALIGIQQLSLENKALKKEVEELKACVESLCNREEKKSSSAGTSAPARLYQNSPNPFGEKTTIRCEINSGFVAARIVVRDLKGQVLKEEKIISKGFHEITIDAQTLKAGTYTYTLEVDEFTIDTKLMVVTR